MKVAALDLGSNTFLMLIADVTAGRITQVYKDELRVTRLGQAVHADRRFHPEALLRAEECFRDYSEILRFHKPDKILAMATSAARDVSNGERLFELGIRYNIPIQIIPGEKEAAITFEGSTFDQPSNKNVCVIDVGGGSTEIISKNIADEYIGESVNVGSVRLTEMFVTTHPIPRTERDKLRAYVLENLKKSKCPELKGSVDAAIAVAGTPTTLAAVIQEKPYSDELVHGYEISLDHLKLWEEKLAGMDLNARKLLPGMDPQRADVIVAGINILIASLETVNLNKLLVSTKGVRYGVALLAEKAGIKYAPNN